MFGNETSALYDSSIKVTTEIFLKVSFYTYVFIM